MKTNKNNLPKKNSRTKNGYYKPIFPEKYVGDLNKIIYRSDWERKFMSFMDRHPDVVNWSSEPEPGIPYLDPISMRERTYFPDFLMKRKTESGFEIFLIEVKPKKDYIDIPDSLLNGYLYSNFNEFRFIVNESLLESNVKHESLRGFTDAVRYGYNVNKMTKKVLKSKLDGIVTYIQNKAKFTAAKSFCEKRGIKFFIADEDTISKL
jgi:hypothetical protein